MSIWQHWRNSGFCELFISTSSISYKGTLLLFPKNFPVFIEDVGHTSFKYILVYPREEEEESMQKWLRRYFIQQMKIELVLFCVQLFIITSLP